MDADSGTVSNLVGVESGSEAEFNGVPATFQTVSNLVGVESGSEV